MVSRSITPPVWPVVWLAVLATPTEATSVKPMRLAEVAKQAEVVQRARVAARDVMWGEHLGHPAIVTVLRFDRVTLLKGEAPVRQVTVFGGTIREAGQDRTMTLLGQPELRLNDEVFLFFERERAGLPCPFVGIWRGAYPVRKGQVLSQGRPVIDFVDGYPALATDNERGMSPAAFQAAVKRAIQAPPTETEHRSPRAETPIRLAPAVKVPTPTTITHANAEVVPSVPIEELVGGTDEAELAEKETLPPEAEDELPLGFRRPGPALGTGPSSFTAPAREPEAREEEER